MILNIRPVGNFIFVSELQEQSRGIVRAVVKGVPEGYAGYLSVGDLVVFRKSNMREVGGNAFVEARALLGIVVYELLAQAGRVKS